MTLRLDSAEIVVSEGACFVNVTIVKNGLTTVDSRVLLSTVQNGTAMGKSLLISDCYETIPPDLFTVGEDYLHVETEVILSPSESIKTVSIPLINNNIQELREWFLVELVLPDDQVGVLLGDPAISNITILDDDRKYMYVNFVYQ